MPRNYDDTLFRPDSNIVFEKDDHGYFVYAPEFPGCYSQGENFEEASENSKTYLKHN